jgi:uncharacterized membrane protein
LKWSMFTSCSLRNAIATPFSTGFTSGVLSTPFPRFEPPVGSATFAVFLAAFLGFGSTCWSALVSGVFLLPLPGFSFPFAFSAFSAAFLCSALQRVWVCAEWTLRNHSTQIVLQYGFISHYFTNPPPWLLLPIAFEG